MKAVNIEWDIDEDIVDASLPREVELPRDMHEDEIADYLSEEYEFCVFGFDVSYDDIDRVLACIREINSNLARMTEFLPEIVDEEGNSADLILDGLEYDAESNSVRAWSHSK